MCYAVINDIPGVTCHAPQGSCQQTRAAGVYCPDIYGTYKKPNGKKKGFVVDCKRYNSDRSINKSDREKLDRDCTEVKKKLKKSKEFEGDKFEVRGMFVTSEGNAAKAEEEGYVVISVGKPGAAYWKIKLKEGFEKAMD